MTRLFYVCADLIRREKGQDLIEYALLASLVALAVMLSVSTFGTLLNDAVWVPFVRQVQNV
jgi:Flp pilus assembly pilin Flp